MTKTCLSNTTQWETRETNSSIRNYNFSSLAAGGKITTRVVFMRRTLKRFSEMKSSRKYPHLEDTLNEWISMDTAQVLSVSRPMLKIKAEKIAETLTHDDSKTTVGDLD